MRVTIRDVARRAGVSTATVSRILSGTSASRPSTVRDVRAAVEALDYRPSGIARSLKLQSTRTIGLIVTDVQNPFFPELVRAVDDVAWAYGFAVLLCNAAGDPDREASYLALLEERRVDGLIVAASHLTAAHATSLSRMGTPVVLANWEGGELSLPSIASDNLGGGRLAVEHLVALGHRRVAVLSGPPHHADAPARLQGALDACAAAGIGAEEWTVEEGGATVASGEAATARVFRRDPTLTAVVAYNDLSAIGAMRALRALRLNVPRDVSVVGFDDIDAAAWVDPPLTTIVQQKGAMGRWAVERLVTAAQSRAPAVPAERVVLPVSLEVRGSTAAPVDRGGGVA